MVLLLLLVIIVLLTYLLFLALDLRDYAKQLEFIYQEDTNQELRIQTRFRFLKKMTLINNQIIRKQKKSRAQLFQETQNLEQAIHNISHDLRTPLSVANGYTQILLAKTENPEKKKTLATIKRNLDSVNVHLESLLNYQRLNEKQVSYNLEKVNLSRIVEEQLANLYESFQANNFTLTLKIQKNIFLITDQSAFSRIVQNILGNMLEHGTQAGIVELTESENKIVFRETNQLSEKIKYPERLTERFYTEDLSRHKQNAGIGLFIVEKSVQDLGGSMSITTDGKMYEITLIFSK